MADLKYEIRDLQGSSNIELQYSNIYKTTLDVSVDDFLLIPTDNDKFKVYIDQGKSIIDLGSPDIPKLTTSIIIPDDLKMEVTIIESDYVEYSNEDIASSKRVYQMNVIDLEINLQRLQLIHYI